VDDDKDDTGFGWITTTTSTSSVPNGLYIWDDSTNAITIADKSYVDDVITVTNNNNTGISINGDNGRWDLEDRIKTIEKVVGIPTRDYNLEEKHPHLKDMFDEHIKKIGKVLHSSEEYEAECEKLRTWETISKENGSSKT